MTSRTHYSWLVPIPAPLPFPTCSPSAAGTTVATFQDPRLLPRLLVLTIACWKNSYKMWVCRG